MVMEAFTSRPARGAWVEMNWTARQTPTRWSRPARGAWVEIGLEVGDKFPSPSRPARGAWVEISDGTISSVADDVAPRKGRVG